MSTDIQGNSETRLPAIVLAAGLSTRMGMFKPVLMLGGEPLVNRVIRSLRDSGRVAEIIVVTGHEREKVAGAVGAMAGVRIVFNPNFAVGEMLSSVRAGIEAIERGSQRARAFVLAFADQPAVDPQTIASVVAGFAVVPDAPLALPTHGGKRGHPIVLSWRLVPEIRALSATDSLRTVVHRHLTEAVLVDVPDASIHEDLDTPADLERARQRYGN